jgi:dolichol-phosphate mannosyltransferase
MEGEVRVSIVVPVYGEADNLLPLHREVTRQMDSLGLPYEFVFVDDGSQDGSLEVLRTLHRQDARVRVVGLSRNFGHQYAVSAGLEYASGDAVITMDADLQHPAELIPEMITLWRQGVQVVYTIRDDRQLGLFKRWTSAAFYRLINAISDTPIIPGGADFRLLDRKVVDQLVAMPERARFLRGMVSWLGYRQQGLHYQANPRLSGRSKYSLRKMIRLALTGVTSFSSTPLRVSAVLGFVTVRASTPYALWAVYARCLTDIAIPGWASLLVVVLFLGGVQLISLGVIGEYLGQIYVEVKQRPLYLTDELLGFESSQRRPACSTATAPRFPHPQFPHLELPHAEATHR